MMIIMFVIFVIIIIVIIIDEEGIFIIIIIVGWKERMGVRSSFSETRAGGQVGWDRWVGGPGGREGAAQPHKEMDSPCACLSS